MKDDKKELTRRDFLKKTGATLLAAGAMSNLGALEALAAEPTKKELHKRRPIDDSWDVIVAGGGPAGCAAAIASAREGAKTLLIESTGMLGGMSTAGNMNAWCPFSDREKVIYNGIAEKIMIESKKGMKNAPTDWMPINTEQLKRVYDKMVKDSGANILFFTQMAGVEMAGNGTVDHVVLANKNGLSRYKAKVYVDCTGDGDLAAWAGAEYFYGNADGKVQASTLCFTIAGVNYEEYRKKGGDGWLHSGSSKSPMHAIFASGQYPHVLDVHMNAKQITPGIIVFNAGHILDIKSIDPNDLTRGIMDGRLLVDELHRGLKAEASEVFGESFLTSTGPLLGIRESRRIKGDYVFTVEDWVARRSFDDEIGRNCYYVDIHIEGAKHYPRYNKGESHGIPFRCLVPEKLTNVIVAGRPISCDEYSFGSLRVMPVCLVTGEAAGLGAALASKMGRVDVHDIDVQQLRKRLKEEGQNIV